MLSGCLPPRFRSIWLTIREQIIIEDFQETRNGGHHGYDSEIWKVTDGHTDEGRTMVNRLRHKLTFNKAPGKLTIEDLQDGFCGRHCGCRNKMILAILNLHVAPISKIFKPHLFPSWIELKLDGRNWSDIQIQKFWNDSVPISKMTATVAILKIFKPRLLKNGKWDWAQTWWEALGWHRDIELFSVPISKIAAMVASLKILRQHLVLNGRSD